MIRAVVIDDEAPARDRMRDLLGGVGVEVAGEAADGETALEQIAILHPDVIFVDIQMPGLSGLDIAPLLSPPRPRIVFCTAFDRFAIEAFEQHAVDYLLKPINRERLLRTVDRLRRDVHEQRAMEEAARTQAGLMPRVDGIGGLECAAVCRPAQGVGGDYYDILPASKGRVALAVADISGKGVYAGILAAAIQARLQSIVSGGESDPGAVLTALDRMTAGRMDGHRFATMMLAVHDPSTSTMAFAGAAHPPALVLSPGGEWRAVASSGAAIGWTIAPFHSEQLHVRAGDVVALYSDGLTETLAPDGSELGADGLLPILQRHLHLPISKLAAAVLEDVASFACDVPALDDRTLLVARVR